MDSRVLLTLCWMSWLRGIDSGDYHRRRVPLHGFNCTPCASRVMGGRERANLTRPRQDRFTAATTSRSITILQWEHQSLRCRCLSDWSLSPHLGQESLVALVSCLDRRPTGSPTDRALYSICGWASWKLHPFIRPLYFLA